MSADAASLDFRPLGVAVVGLGMVGKDHAEILHALPEVRLLVAADIDSGRAAVVPAGVEFVTDPLAALEHPGVEAVWICTPQHLHRDLVVAALERGLHVFCEKPLASTLADADAMIETAARAPGVLAVGHTLRFHPDYRAAHRAVASGQVGEPVHLAARWNTGDHEGRIISGRTTVPLEMAIHDIDILRWIAGEVTEVYATASSITPCGPGPDAVVGTLRFASGAVAALEHNWIMPFDTGMRSDHRLAVFGTKGSAYVELRQTPTQVFGTAGSSFPNSTYRPPDLDVPAGALASADRYFVQTVRTGLPWPLGLDDARAALAIALAMDRSIARGLPVRLDEVEESL